MLDWVEAPGIRMLFVFDPDGGASSSWAGQMKLGTMADLTADITPEKRERIDAIKAEMADAERGHDAEAPAGGHLAPSAP
ncbi:hypothetical protein [Streptomyces xinghaiensis]|uniref:hypothetical protein n=1 Tax=Streptomyces xinghaiensis TaxID=1038928 RepID=UPI0002DC7AE5|nr:hypothetical protein [Streptomyces xinghaiensis]